MHISARSKVLSTILSIAFISSPFVASALSTSDLNGQIQSIAAQLQVLLQQIQSLSSSGSTQVDTSAFSNTLQSIKTQIQTLGTTSGGSGVSDSGQSSSGNTNMPTIAHRCGAFTRNLVIGSQGSDVSDLQKILVENNLLDSGSVSGVFGQQTSTALAQFQSKFNVSLPLGTVGPITREFLLRLCHRIDGGGFSSDSSTGTVQACTADAKVCPDGSAVGRTGPNCSFATCPTTDSWHSTIFTATPASGATPLSVSFSASGLQSSNQVIIDYGDGADSGALQTVCLSSNGDPANPSKTSCSLPTTNTHVYTQPGTYTVSLNTYVACLYSNPRCMLAQLAPFATTVVTVTGTGVPQPLSFTAMPTSGTVPLSVQFKAISYPTNYSGVTVNFGDGTSGTLNPASVCATCSIQGTVSHTYAQVGTYTATLVQACTTNTTSGVNLPLCTSASTNSSTVLGSVTIAVSSVADSIVKIYSISPTSGAVGDTINISGFGFTSANTILMDGSVIATNVPITSSIAISCTTDPNCVGGIHQGLTFTIPSYFSPNCPSGMACPMYMHLVTPGTYPITVRNDSGSSNAAQLKVTNTSPVGCTPRPACLDTAPFCQIDVHEPAGGWCPTTTDHTKYGQTCTSTVMQCLYGGGSTSCPNFDYAYYQNLCNAGTTGGTGGICTADAMMCPNGTYVGRSGPNCSFDCSGTPTPTPAPGLCNCPMDPGSPFTTAGSGCACGSSGTTAAGNTTGGTLSSSACNVFTRTLLVGSQGSDVTLLQQILAGKGLLTLGSITGYFGSITQGALVQFQSHSGIEPAGIFGPATRSFVQQNCNELTATATTNASSAGGVTGSGYSTWLTAGY